MEKYDIIVNGVIIIKKVILFSFLTLIITSIDLTFEEYIENSPLLKINSSNGLKHNSVTKNGYTEIIHKINFKM